MADKLFQISNISVRHKFYVSAISIGTASALLLSYTFRKKIFAIFRNWKIDRAIKCKKEIYTITNKMEWENIYPQFIREAEIIGAVGFDCEWTQIPEGRKPVALLQLATSSGLCTLIKLSHLRSCSDFPTSLKEFLANPNILKAGVGTQNDKKYLLFDYNLPVNGAIDLRELEQLIQIKKNRKEIKVGLKALAKRYLGKTLSKDWKVRGGNWDADPLSELQINYAADDALVGIHILIKMVGELHSSPDSLLLQINPDIPTAIKRICHNMTDTIYTDISSSYPKPQGHSLVQQSIQNKEAKESRRHNSTRKTPLYQNSQLLAPDGEPLCTCDPSKAYWYVNKELGDLISEEPLVVKLRFEPAGRPIKEGPDGMFYLQERQNICVVCGKEDSYIRKNIVPHEYRKYFPTVLKSHQSHDVVLLCVQCHQRSNIKDTTLRFELAEEFDAPIGCETDVRTTIDGQLKTIKSTAGALVKSRHKMPVKRVQELENILKNYYGTNELTNDLIEEASNLDIVVLNQDYTPHGFKVYEAFKKIGVIMLEQKWRQWFLDVMEPQFMPNNWSVNHNHEKLKIKMSRHALDDPLRDDYKTSLVGTEGEIDIPYIPPQRSRGENILSSSSSDSSREVSPDT